MENRPKALVVPSAAIQTGNQGSYVWVVGSDAKGAATAGIQPVKVALSEGQVTILDGGLQPGQFVVVDGADRLRPGQIVTASNAHVKGGQGPTRQGRAQGSPTSSGQSAAANGNSDTRGQQ